VTKFGAILFTPVMHTVEPVFYTSTYTNCAFIAAD